MMRWLRRRVCTDTRAVCWHVAARHRAGARSLPSAGALRSCAIDRLRQWTALGGKAAPCACEAPGRRSSGRRAGRERARARAGASGSSGGRASRPSCWTSATTWSCTTGPASTSPTQCGPGAAGTAPLRCAGSRRGRHHLLIARSWQWASWQSAVAEPKCASAWSLAACPAFCESAPCSPGCAAARAGAEGARGGHGRGGGDHRRPGTHRVQDLQVAGSSQ